MPQAPPGPIEWLFSFILWAGAPTVFVAILTWLYWLWGVAQFGKSTVRLGVRTVAGVRSAFVGNTQGETRFLLTFVLASLPGFFLLFAVGQLFSATFGLSDQLGIPGLFDDDLSPSIWGTLLDLSKMTPTTDWILLAALASLALMVLARYSQATWLSVIAIAPWYLVLIGLCIWTLLVGFFFVVAGLFGILGGFSMHQSPMPVLAQGTYLVVFIGLIGSMHLILHVFYNDEPER